MLRALGAGQTVVITGWRGEVLGVIDEGLRRDRLELTGALSVSCRHVVVDPDAPLNSVLRSLEQAGASLAVVAAPAATGPQEVLGVITEREIAGFACEAAKLGD